MFYIKKQQNKHCNLVSKRILKQFCKEGTTGWKNACVQKKHGIYIANFWSPFLANCIPRIFYAKGIQENCNTKIKILGDCYSAELEKFYDTMGCKGQFLRKKIVGNLSILLQGLFLTTKFWLKDHSGKALAELKYKSVPIGEDIYDTIVREIPKLYTIDKLKFSRDFKRIVLLYCVAICSYKMFKSSPPLYYICEDTSYLENIVLKMAIFWGAQVVQVTYSGRIIVIRKKKDLTLAHWEDLTRYRIIEKMKSPDGDYHSYVQQYFNERFKGRGDKEARYAFQEKTILDREEFLQRLGIDNGKKNIFIMAHCFTDAPHCSSFLLYKDYYAWVEETLKIASDITDVNWIVKAHPTRKHYGEGDEVYELTKKYNKGSLTYMPDELSTVIVKEVADGIVTCMGTAGQEFACFGIPVVIAAQACYAGLGFTIEPKTIEEYVKVLRNIAYINSLNQEQRETAIQSLYCRLQLLDYKPFDWFDEQITANGKVALIDGEGFRKANDELLLELSDLFKNMEKIYNTEFFKRGKNIMYELNDKSS